MMNRQESQLTNNDDVDISNQFDDAMFIDEDEMPNYRTQSVQTDVCFDDNDRGKMTMFISVTNNISSNNNEAACQVNHEQTKPIVHSRSIAVGTDASISAFYGFSSIEQSKPKERLLQHLASVRPQVFQTLLDHLEESGYRPRVNRSKDLLLLFLMKVKHDISFRCLSIIFNIPMTTTRCNFYHILHRLELSMRDFI